MVTSALEADAFKHKLLVEFYLHPGSLMVSHMPLVPFFLTWTKQILRIAADSVVLSSDSCSSVKVVALKSAGLDLYVHRK